MNCKRETFVDYAKALMIFVVVLTHSGFEMLNSVTYIAMSCFFLLSGYTYTKGKRTLKESSWLNFKSQIVKYWEMMVVYGFFEIIRANYFGYGGVSIVLPNFVGFVYGSSHNLPYINGISDTILKIMSYKSQTQGFVDVILPTNCHLWFLPAMFTGIVIFNVYVEKLRRGLFSDVTFCTVMVLLASTEALPNMIQLPYGLGRGFFAAACMLVGFNLKEKKFYNSGKRNIFLYVIFAAVSIMLYFIGAKDSALVRSVYGPYGMLGAFIVFVSGALGTISILGILKALEFFNRDNIFSFIGRNTITIYSWHMMFLTIYSLILFESVILN